jgi:hypothetical protein
LRRMELVPIAVYRNRTAGSNPTLSAS